jgi:hypothetical protein
MVGDLMALAAPTNELAQLYAFLGAKGKDRDGRNQTERREWWATNLWENPTKLVDRFKSSLDKTTKYFATHDPGTSRFYEATRADLETEPGVTKTSAVGALMEAYKHKRYDVLGDDALSFYYIDRELLVTQSKNLDTPSTSETASLRLDLLLASATDRLPIVCELKVTSPDGRPDKDPFFALIQALACASYLLPPQQMKRLMKHDTERRLEIDSGRLDVYVLTVDEPPASKPWFRLRDAAERLSALTITDLSKWIRTIAFVELAWLELPLGIDRPSGKTKRPPRVTKRFAVSSSDPTP